MFTTKNVSFSICFVILLCFVSSTAIAQRTLDEEFILPDQEKFVPDDVLDYETLGDGFDEQMFEHKKKLFRESRLIHV